MIGYSGTPLPAKLGIKPDHAVVLLNAPSAFESELDGLPDGASITRKLPKGRSAGVILLFCADRKKLAAGFAKAASVLIPEGGLWVCWPKKSSGVATDLTENDVRAHGLEVGLVDNKVCAVTEIWSGLRLVYRLEDRARLIPARSAGRGTGAGSRAARSASPRARRT